MANWEPDEALGQNLVDFRNEERRSRMFDISPRERDDEEQRRRRDFDPEPEEQVWYEVRVVDDED